jgi:hypothetical protein
MPHHRKKKRAPEIPRVDLKISQSSLPKAILDFSVSTFPAFSSVRSRIQSRQVRRIVCLGVGDPCSSFSARFQFAFILKIASVESIQTMEFFDPICCADCRLTLRKMGVKCITEDCEGRFEVDGETLFFMPHCPRFLYHNLLVENWASDRMANVLILGNSFESYSERCKAERRRKRSAVEDLFDAGIAEEEQLDFNGSDTFLHLAIISVNGERLEEVGSGCFGQRPEFMGALVEEQ